MSVDFIVSVYEHFDNPSYMYNNWMILLYSFHFGLLVLLKSIVSVYEHFDNPSYMYNNWMILLYSFHFGLLVLLKSIVSIIFSIIRLRVSCFPWSTSSLLWAVYLQLSMEVYPTRATPPQEPRLSFNSFKVNHWLITKGTPSLILTTWFSTAHSVSVKPTSLPWQPLTVTFKAT